RLTTSTRESKFSSTNIRCTVQCSCSPKAPRWRWPRVYLASPRVQRSVFTSRRLGLTAVIVILAGVAFTFVCFGRNQNLKAQLFTRTTQAKQLFRLAQWALDFDRDGYSALLGGGDADDRRADINPGRKEIPGDGIDNNQIGGDLTAEAQAEWFQNLQALHGSADPSARR